MKTPLILVFALAVANLAFAQPYQVEVQARYEGIDPSFTKDVLDRKTKDFTMPRITVQSGRQAAARMTRDYGYGLKSGENGVRSSGATIFITPVVKGKTVQVAGKSLLIRPESWRSKDILHPISFTTLETFFEGTVPINRDVVVKLSEHSPERLILKFALMDSKGKPVK